MTKQLDEGKSCPCANCKGTLEYPPVENCSCHLNPPCSACVDNLLTCNMCGWEDGEDIGEAPR